jgi:class 3 adenylate cyclase
MTTTEPATVDLAPATPPGEGKRRRGRITFQSELLMMLLGVSILSTLVVGFIGYRSGTNALRETQFDRMTEIRQSRMREMQALFDTSIDTLVLFSGGAAAVEATQAFTTGFAELQSAPITPEDEAAVRQYYDTVYVPGLSERTGESFTSDPFLPDSPAQVYLQARYTAPFDDFDEAIQFEDAGDGSAWTAAHARYHHFLRQVVLRLEFEDVLLLDTQGNVVYSAYKGVDFGTNVRTGPFRGPGLQAAYDEAMAANSIEFTTRTDLVRYQPSNGIHQMWLVSPVGAGGEIVGAMALQVGIGSTNAVMTGNEGWETDGLGETGETYLVGADNLMRSVSRELREEPEHFGEDLREGGVRPALVDRILEVRGTVGLLPVETEPVARALSGETGTMITEDYRGHEVLAAYAPLPSEELQWVVVAQIDADEAFTPVQNFTRNLAVAIALIVLLVSLAALVLARLVLRPLKRLVTGVRQIAAGDLEARVEPSRTAEFDDLASAFNDMGRSLSTKAELIEEQQQENDRILLNIMPEQVVQRYRQGEEGIAQEHQNVSVIYADVLGFESVSLGQPSARSAELLNELVEGIDEAAERHGVEKMRTIGAGYLGSCGVVVPRIDHARRAVDFARDIEDIVQRFSARHDLELSLRVGIASGTVTAGLVGRRKFIYDLWGESVNVAHRVHGAASGAGIFVSDAVRQRLANQYQFEEAGTVPATEGQLPVWRLAQTSRDQQVVPAGV